MKKSKKIYVFLSLIFHFLFLILVISLESNKKIPEAHMIISEIIVNEKNDIKGEKSIKKEKKTENITKKIKLQKSHNKDIKKIKSETKILIKNQNILKEENFTKKKENKAKSQKNSNKKKQQLKKNINSNFPKSFSKASYKIGSLKNPHPPYPLVARKKGLQGKLILNVYVKSDGKVKNIEIEKSSGHRVLDEVSKKTIYKWSFRPAKMDNKYVEDNLKIPVRFILDNRN